MKIDLYTNRQAAQVLQQLVNIAQKAHGINPNPVEIKLELAEINPMLLQELSTNFTEILKDPKPLTHPDYWRCNCTSKNIHRKDGLVYCERCDMHSLDTTDALLSDVEEMIQESLTK